MSSPSDRDETKRTVILVLGMHRSGTSALAGALHILGAHAPRTLMPADVTNPRGFWESDVIVPIHDELLGAMGSTWHDWQEADRSWLEGSLAAPFAARLAEAVVSEFGDSPLFVIKDPRVCRLVPFWIEICRRLNLRVVVFHIFRNPLEVAQSLEQRDGFTLEQSCLLWLRHLLDAEADSRSMPRYFIEYDRLLKDPAALLEDAARHTQITWPRSVLDAGADLAGFLSNDLYRQRATHSNVEMHPGIAQWVKDAYGQFLRLASEQHTAAALSALDEIGREFRAASRLFGAVVASEIRERVVRVEELTRALATSESARDVAIAELTGQVAANRADFIAVSREAAELSSRLAEHDADAKAQAADAQARIAKLEHMLTATRVELALAAEEADARNVPADSQSRLKALRRPWTSQRRTVAAEFDKAFYLATNPDVKEAGIDPLDHFVRHGWQEGRDPTPWFSMDAYLDMYPDVRAAGLNAFYHFLLAGRNEGRQALRSDRADSPPDVEPAYKGDQTLEVQRILQPHFDREFYLERNPDVAAARVDPLEHYVRCGWREGRDPASDFATSYYLDANPDVAAAGINPFYHYLVAGKRENRPAVSPEAGRSNVLTEASCAEKPMPHLIAPTGQTSQR